MRLFEVTWPDGVSRIVFGKTANAVRAKMENFGFRGFSVVEIVIN